MRRPHNLAINLDTLVSSALESNDNIMVKAIESIAAKITRHDNWDYYTTNPLVISFLPEKIRKCVYMINTDGTESLLDQSSINKVFWGCMI